MEDQSKQTNNIQTVFVDTNVFVAWVKADDAHHKRAKRLFAALADKSIMFFTSNYVFSEAVTVISQHLGHAIAVQFIDTMSSPTSRFHITWADETLDEKAVQIFKKQTSKNVSLVDCANMAMVDMHHFDYLFSFDQVYKKNGYRLIEELV
jgi:predicted nucleic acid-binding protein